MNLYDINGDPLGVGSDAVKTAFQSLISSGEINIGSVPGVTLGYEKTVATDDWTAKGKTQYDAMLAVFKTLDNNAVPFFLSTDQHGSGLEQHRWANNIDKDGMEYPSINLGDTLNTTDFAGFDALIPRVKLVKNYISVPGNHDYAVAAGENVDIPDPYHIKKMFYTTYPNRVTLDANSDTYVVVDGNHNVKYLASDNYWLNSNNQNQNTSATASYCEAVIKELSKDDFDIIFLQHWPPHTSNSSEWSRRDGSTPDVGYPSGVTAIRALLSARKAKTQGTVTDADGNTHTFDFRNMNHELLCCLSGHMHDEVYGYLDGVLAYCADRLSSAVFGIVDRQNSLLRIWRWNTTTVFAEFDLPLTT